MRTPSSFEDLIEPVTARDFFTEHWEKKLLHLSRNQNGAFDGLFSLRDLDHWLMSVHSDFADSVVLAPPAGAETGQKRYRPQDARVDALYECFTRGYSIVLNHLETTWPPMARFVKMLGKTFCGDVGANLYLTPKGSRTFPLHVDDHDVFVLQIYGEKAWRLHELRLTPVDRSHLKHAADLAFTAEWGRDRVETPLLAELRMQPGDVLYIPRGMPHCAVAKDATSLHLTLSIAPVYWLDFLKAAVEQAHVRSPELRKALPVGYLNDPQAAETMRAQFAVAMEAFQSQASFEETLDVIRKHRIQAQGLPPDGHFAQLDNLPELATESEVEQRENLLISVESSGDFSHIRFGPQDVRGPGQLRRAFEFIRNHQRFKVGEIPDLDDQGKLVLVRRLIREGLLRFAGEQPTANELELASRFA